MAQPTMNSPHVVSLSDKERPMSTNAPAKQEPDDYSSPEDGSYQRTPSNTMSQDSHASTAHVAQAHENPDNQTPASMPVGQTTPQVANLDPGLYSMAVPSMGFARNSGVPQQSSHAPQGSGQGQFFHSYHRSNANSPSLPSAGANSTMLPPLFPTPSGPMLPISSPSTTHSGSLLTTPDLNGAYFQHLPMPGYASVSPPMMNSMPTMPGQFGDVSPNTGGTMQVWPAHPHPLPNMGTGADLSPFKYIGTPAASPSLSGGGHGSAMSSAQPNRAPPTLPTRQLRSTHARRRSQMNYDRPSSRASLSMPPQSSHDDDDMDDDSDRSPPIGLGISRDMNDPDDRIPINAHRREDVRRARIESEQRRRNEMRLGFERLRDALPPTTQRLSKSLILDSAVAHIHLTQTQLNMSFEQVRALQAELDDTKRQMKKLIDGMPRSGRK